MREQAFHFLKWMRRDRLIERAAKVMASLPLDEAWVLRIERLKRERTHPQNAYLNGVAYKIFGKHFGYDREDVSEHFCGEYFGWKQKKVPPSFDHPDGFKRVPVRTTTTNEAGERDVLDKQAFADYVDFVQRYAAEHGVFIPDPDPDYRQHERRAA